MNGLEAVVTAQEFVKKHYNDDGFCVQYVCNAVSYSRRQMDRLFKKYINMTMYEYINAVVLSKSAERLLDTNNRVLDIALDSHYNSHEGFTRSFEKQFSVTPDEYRKSKIAIPLFTQYPANHSCLLKGKQTMDNISVCTVTPVQRPKRKLIYLPSKSASCYFSYCEEMGCGWEGLLNSIPEKFDTAALINLPEFLLEKGFSKTASGIEVPLDYDKPLPEGYRIAELDECIMLYFQSEPFENPDDFGAYIGQVFKAKETYNFERYGYKAASNIAPDFNFGAEPETGARIAISVIKL